VVARVLRLVCAEVTRVELTVLGVDARTRAGLLVHQQADDLRVRGAEAGVQLLLELPPGTDVTAILRAAARRGIELCNLYEMQLQPGPLDPGLLVGYGNIKDTAIDGAVAALAEVIHASG